MSVYSSQDDLRYTIALMNMSGIGSIYARYLIAEFGSASAVFEAEPSVLAHLPRIGTCILEQRNNPELLQRAEEEIQFVEEHHIQTLIYGQPGYPKRLLDCPDAPTLLYYLGNADLDSQHIVSIVGTRSCTQYGRDSVSALVSDLKQQIPNLVVVSGLALGIDVSAHHAALEQQVPTVGVVAHGLDRIYPATHRQVAKKMVAQGGGIITEYPSKTEIARGNFLARNRIIAGLCDAIVIAESKDKGGALVTANIAHTYNKDVFAFPGRIGDNRSQGCNRLIKQNRAALITSGSDLIEMMGWTTSHNSKSPLQHEILFPDTSELGKKILDALLEHGDMRISEIAHIIQEQLANVAEEILTLELQDRVRSHRGGIYQLK